MRQDTCAFSKSEWQLDVTFPDWKGDISSEFAINNCVDFYGYSGQGQVYLECDDEVSDFELFINGGKIDVSSAEAGKSYLADVSLLTVNGINSVQVGALEEGNVRICIPYPVIIPGTPDEAGIDERAFEGCPSLSKIYYKGDFEDFDEITIYNSDFR